MDAGQHLPYTNTRLLLQSEVEDSDSYYLAGTVVRLYSSTEKSHPAVRQTLQGLQPRRVSLGALAVQAIVNKRGPDGVVGVIPGEDKHSARLLSLCQQCYDSGEVLACSMPSADMVLVPRVPATAAQDGLYFLAYATNLRAVEMCERLRQQKQVALVLDLDNTLVDAVSCTIAPNDWELLDWRYVLVTNSYGRQIQAQYAPLPGHDPYSDDVWVMHWRVGRINCTFKVRVRPGWAELREFLVQHSDKYAVFVCSKGKREYIQLLWLMLDPLGQVIPESDWDTRLTSTFPDTLTQAANKTALTALGCYDITKPHVPTQLALPMICLDDSTEAYEPEYEHSIMYVQEYRPSDLLEGDNGNVLRQARGRLEAFWTATCASEGTFAWQAAQSFAVALMKTMQRNPMGSPDDLSYLQVRCAKQGEALWHQFTVREVFGEPGVFIADDPDKDVPRRTYVTPGTLLCSTCQLPECKPGCPGSPPTAAAVAGISAAQPAGPGDGGGRAEGGVEAQAAGELPTPAAEAAAPLLLPPLGLGGAANAAAEEAALSDGRSSEDSMLLGLPSPACSVLPASLHRLSAGLMAEVDGRSGECEGDLGSGQVAPAAEAGCGYSSHGDGDASPTAEPRPKLQRLADDGPAFGHLWGFQASAAAAAATAHQQLGASPPSAVGAAAATASPPGGSVLSAALRGISRGLEEEGLGSSSSNLPALHSRGPAAAGPPVAAPPPPLAEERRTGAAAAAGGGDGSSLAAALAAISKGLVQDGLL